MGKISRIAFRRQLRFELLEARVVFDSTAIFALNDSMRPQSIDSNHDDGTLRFDQRGLAYHYDGDVFDFSLLNASPIQPVSGSSSTNGGSSGNGSGLSFPPSPVVVPIYHSNPSFSKKIYLDFDGEMVTGTVWNNQNYTGSYNTGSTIHAPVFSTDGDLTTFNSSELATIQEVWARVAEDFAPFQVDVTTEFPGAAAFTTGGQAIRVVISTNIDATTGGTWFPSAGGVAYLDSWTWTDGSPVWAFSNMLGNGFPKYVAEAVSHEVGHAFGLGHDGRTPSEGYYQGHGTGATGWAPIMGVGYYRSLAQWSQGEYTDANNQEDDVDVISQAVGFIVDDHGDNGTSATQLVVGTGGAIASSGVISTRTDKDAFRFGTQAGNISINVSPFDFATGKANLDTELKLLNAAGATVTTVNAVNALESTVTLTVPKGYYTLVVDGIGRAAISGDEGYSDYGSLGKYTLSGSVVPNPAPVAVADNANVGIGSSVLIDVLANDTDANMDVLSIQSIGSPSIGTAVMESGKIRYTPPTNYIGIVSFPYTLVDEFGATATGQVTVNVHTVIATRGAFYPGATGSSASSSIATDKVPLLPGQSSTFANYTNYSRGLNGIVIDVAGLPATTTNSQMLASLQFAHWNGISAGGFSALPALAIPSVTVLNSGGSNGSGRVQITFPDNTIENTWLRVTVLANSATLLPANDVFYFGNVIGDVNVGNTATRLRVNATDTGAVRSNQSTADNSANVLNIYDINRDGRVNATDTGIVRSNQQTAGIVAPITAPSLSPPPAMARGSAAPLIGAAETRKGSDNAVNQLISSVAIDPAIPPDATSVPYLDTQMQKQFGPAINKLDSSRITNTKANDKAFELTSIDSFFASIWL